MRLIFALALFAFVFVSCESQKARKPIEVTSGTFFKESAQRNKKLLQYQEKMIKNIIDRDTAHHYLNSDYGFWYFYNTEKKNKDLRKPKKGDQVIFKYNIAHLNGNIIYSQEEMGKRQVEIDKDGVFSGLRWGLKLMNEGETATFYFPSSLAFGYYGDTEKIGPNVPIKSTVTLLTIQPKKDSVQVQPKTKP